jgi:hypothetical protein
MQKRRKKGEKNKDELVLNLSTNSMFSNKKI